MLENWTSWPWQGSPLPILLVFTTPPSSASPLRLMWDLCPPDQHFEIHIDFVVNDLLSIPRYRSHHFKFGITHQPAARWTEFPDYQHLDAMCLVYTSEDSCRTADWETRCISKFKSDFRLKNRKPGGENAHCGYSPHFLYIVLGTDRQFDAGRRSASSTNTANRYSHFMPFTADL